MQATNVPTYIRIILFNRFRSKHLFEQKRAGELNQCRAWAAVLVPLSSLYFAVVPVGAYQMKNRNVLVPVPQIPSLEQPTQLPQKLGFHIPPSIHFVRRLQINPRIFQTKKMSFSQLLILRVWDLPVLCVFVRPVV